MKTGVRKKKEAGNQKAEKGSRRLGSRRLGSRTQKIRLIPLLYISHISIPIYILHPSLCPSFCQSPCSLGNPNFKTTVSSIC
jgi:hypothetical protein